MTRYLTDEIMGEEGGAVEFVNGLTAFGHPVSSSIADVTISSAELLALNATPKTLVAAPGAGKAVIVDSVELFLDYNSAAYDGVAAGEDLSILYASAGEIARVETTGFLDQAADQRRFVPGHLTAVPSAAVIGVNEAVKAQLLTDEIATGDSPLYVRVRYRIIDVIS